MKEGSMTEERTPVARQTSIDFRKGRHPLGRNSANCFLQRSRKPPESRVYVNARDFS
jgi:hypothetical protein